MLKRQRALTQNVNAMTQVLGGVTTDAKGNFTVVDESCYAWNLISYGILFCTFLLQVPLQYYVRDVTPKSNYWPFWLINLVEGLAM